MKDKTKEILDKSDILSNNKVEILDSKEKNIFQIIESIPDSKEFYEKIELNDKATLCPRIPGIFILFDSVDYYFINFHKFEFFNEYKTTIPKSIDEIEVDKKIETINYFKEYIKEFTNIHFLLETKNITIDDIILDYILYFISKKEKLTRDSCDIKYFHKILLSLINIKKKNNKLEDIEYFIDLIIFFNCFNSQITYPLNAIKFLHDENIIEIFIQKF